MVEVEFGEPEGVCKIGLASIQKLIGGHEFTIVFTAEPDLPIFEVFHQFAIVLVIQRSSPNYSGLIDTGTVIDPFVLDG